MSIRIQDCDKFKDLVETLIQKYNTPNGVCVESLLPELYKYACQYSGNYLPTRMELSLDHKTGVNSTQLDFNMIMFTIMGISWAVRMRKIKSSEGQCWRHQTNCNDTKQFHKEIYNQWIQTVESLLEALKSDSSMKY